MRSRLDDDLVASALERVDRASRRAGRGRQPGPAPLLPVQTLVVGAHQLRHDTVERTGQQALRQLQACAPDCVALIRALRLPGWQELPTDPARVDALLAALESDAAAISARSPEGALAHEVYRRLVDQLRRAPVQDLRVDFHEAFGHRPEDEEDATAASAAGEIGKAMRAGTLPPRVGIRTAPLDRTTGARALRTLDLFLSALVDATGGVPDGFVVSLPDVTLEDQVTAMVQVLAALEHRLDLRKGALGLEIGVDRADAMVDAEGRLRSPLLVRAAAGRCVAVRIDATAIGRSLGVVTADADVAVRARDLCRLALAGTGLPVAYGTAPDPEDGPPEIGRGGRDAAQIAAVLKSWRAHADRVARALRDGVPWGWDLHPGHVVARLATVYAHLRPALGELRRDLVDAVVNPERTPPLDGQRRLDALLLAVDCGAVSPSELEAVGMDAEDLGGRSYLSMLARRRR